MWYINSRFKYMWKCNVIDNIEHYLYFCNFVKQFWDSLERWWNDKSDCQVILSKKHVIFGFYYDLMYFSGINYVILLGKMYIYRQKMIEGSICLDNFLPHLKSKLEIEETICQKNNNFLNFEKKWRAILQSF